MEIKTSHQEVPDEVFSQYLQEIGGNSEVPNHQNIMIRGPGVEVDLMLRATPHRPDFFKMLRRYLISVDAHSFALVTPLPLQLFQKNGDDVMECLTLCCFMGFLDEAPVGVASRFVPIVHDARLGRWKGGTDFSLSDDVIDTIALASDSYLLYPNDSDKPLPPTHPHQIQQLIDDFGKRVMPTQG